MEPAVNLQPAHYAVIAMDPTGRIESTALDRLQQSWLERLRVPMIEVGVEEYALGQRTFVSGAPEYLVQAVVFPEDAIRVGLPFEDAKARVLGRDQQQGLAFVKGRQCLLAAAYVDVDAENLVRPRNRLGPWAGEVSVLAAQKRFGQYAFGPALRRPVTATIVHGDTRPR